MLKDDRTDYNAVFPTEFSPAMRHLITLIPGDGIGPEVTELLAELSMARMLEGTAQEVGSLVHAHPTLSEVVKESALAARGEAIHM